MKNILWPILRDATHDTIITHDGVEHAGYLSFLMILALFPFLVFMVSLTGFLGEGELGKQAVVFLRDHLPKDIMAALMPRVDEIISGPSRALLTISMFAAIWTASSAVEGYRTVLNRAYHVGTPPSYIWRRLLSIVQLLIFSFLTLIGILLLVFMPLAMEWVEYLLGLQHHLAESLAWDDILRPVLIGVIFGVVVLMYYILPNIKQSLRAVVPGAALTVGLWLLSANVFRIYLTSFDQVNLIYGSLGGVIAALLFFYMINLIFIFGAELNYQIIHHLGLKVREKEKTDQIS